jgi:MFS family permease
MSNAMENGFLGLNPFAMCKGLPKQVYYVFWVQVVNCAGNFVVPFLSLYLTTVLGMSFKAAGIVAGAAVLLQLPGSLIGGFLADHLPRKYVYAAAQAAAGSFILPCAFITKQEIVIAFILSAAFFNAVARPALNAIVIDLLSPAKRKQGFSLIYLGINMGFAVGPLVAGFMFEHHLRLFFVVNAVATLLAAGILLFSVKETVKVPELNMANSNQRISLFGSLWNNSGMLVFLLLMAVFGFVYVQSQFSLPLTLNETFAAKGPVYYGYLMSVNAVTVLVLTAGITHITRNTSFLLNIALGGLFYAVGFGMISFLHNLILYCLSTVLWSIGEILQATNMNVYIANNSPPQTQARYNAAGVVALCMGNVISMAGIGTFVQDFGTKAVWPLLFSISVAAAGLIYVLQRWPACRREPQRKSL